MNLDASELEHEKQYLDETTKEIKNQISSLGLELYEKEEKIKEFQKFIWDSRADMDDQEMKSMMGASELEITLAQSKSNHFKKLYKVQDNPYFGSITFDDGEESKKIYIGMTHVEREEDGEHLVHDWRAPISSMFYDYEVGHASYLAPEGIIEGEITNKRQFNIKKGKLVRVFDNNLNIDDELLQEVLEQESSDKMRNIVNTIQQEQNSIIRNVVDNNLIVQGIAGSGKTSVALHRIAFLLYKIKNLSSKNVLIFSPNKIFTEYISNVLPELGEDNTMQTTFNDFLLSNLQEYKTVESFSSFVERYYKYLEPNKKLVKYKQSDDIIKALDSYIELFIKNLRFTSDIEIDDKIIEKDELNYLLKDRYEKLLLFDRLDEIGEKICRDYFNGKHARKSTIMSRLKNSLSFKLDFKLIYKEFLKSIQFLAYYDGTITDNEINKCVSRRDINYEDACLMVYIKGKLEGFKYLGLIKEVVIDEAQDYTKLQYIIIRNIFKKSKFTILGDTNQTVNPYYHYDTLESLNEIFDNGSIYLELSKTYRSTPEIIEYTNKILGLDHVSAIRRDSNKPVEFRNDYNDLKETMVNDINKLINNKYSVAVITKTDEEAEELFKTLENDIPGINLLNNNTKDFNKNLVIIPSYIAKGLEFDSVIIYTDKNNKYTEKEKYLYYVACTRAQHELIIYNQ
jgi:DNA helicase-2/ATP-dependent DNA helicase PcrA